jgi:uncharacterized surface anchored protein
MLLALALLAPTTAFAAEGATGYNQTPPPPTTTTTTTTPTTPKTPTPSAGTSPSKEKGAPANETSPTSTAATGANTAAASTGKASTLPFTGLDLRWTIGIGLLLIGTGLSVMVVQRRHRRDSGR